LLNQQNLNHDGIYSCTGIYFFKSALFRLYSIWLFLCTIQIHCLIFLHRYICTCITLISSLSAYPSPSDTSHAYLKIAVAQICLHHKIRYCTIKSFFSILKLTIIFLCLLGAFTSSYNASKSYFVLCYNKTTKKWLSHFFIAL
jgi:hypothetical protein